MRDTIYRLSQESGQDAGPAPALSRPDGAPSLSALVVAHNEQAHLADCLDRLAFADQVVVVLDDCSDASRAACDGRSDLVVEGAWEIEGRRRNLGLDACGGAWVLEVDADERVSDELAAEIRRTIADSEGGYYLIPFLNYVGGRMIRHGWGPVCGVDSAPRLSSRGSKRWGDQRVHPALTLPPLRGRLQTPIDHYVDRDISDMIDRLNRYTDARAADLRAEWARTGKPDGLANNLRRMVSRFLKAYFGRKGYREGGWGLLLAMFSALYPLLGYLKAKLEPERE